MSKYTTTVRIILESLNKNNDLSGLNAVEELISAHYEEIFDSDIPFYNDTIKKDLCNKILRHYYMYEIGFETPALWKLYLNEKMRLIMPYYNELYRTFAIKYDPLNNYSMTTEKRIKDDSTIKNDGTDSSTNNDTMDSDTTTKNSDYPQGNAAINDDYLSSVSASKNHSHSDLHNESETHSTIKNDGLRTESETVKGNNSFTQTQLLVEYRSAIMNVEKQIIDELRNLFLTIY